MAIFHNALGKKSSQVENVLIMKEIFLYKYLVFPDFLNSCKWQNLPSEQYEELPLQIHSKQFCHSRKRGLNSYLVVPH